MIPHIMQLLVSGTSRISLLLPRKIAGLDTTSLELLQPSSTLHEGSVTTVAYARLCFALHACLCTSGLCRTISSAVAYVDLTV